MVENAAVLKEKFFLVMKEIKRREEKYKGTLEMLFGSDGKRRKKDPYSIPKFAKDLMIAFYSRRQLMLMRASDQGYSVDALRYKIFKMAESDKQRIHGI